MHIKRYIAVNMPEALRLVKDELGDAAIILNSRKIEHQGKTQLEVTAAVDSLPETTAPRTYEPARVEIPERLTEVDSKLRKHLDKHGVLPDISAQIDRAVVALEDAGFSDFDTLDMVLGKLIPFAQPAASMPKKAIHLFVGPTGAGKSTTICKIAVNKKIDKHSVGLISLDHHKVGAYEQMAIFAEAMGEKAYQPKTAEELEKALSNLKGRDYIFVDMQGLNPWNKSQIKTMKNKIDDVKALSLLPVHVHLVLPATLNPMEMAGIPASLSTLGLETILFTKFDETSYFGGLTNIAVNSGLQVCYITDGPRVPDDILQLDSAILAEKLMKQPRLPWETY